MRDWIEIVEAAQRFYIRFGDVPDGERSGIGNSPNIWKHMSRKSDHEIGVSVFDAEWSDGLSRWEIVDVGNFATLESLLASRRPIFLVTGRAVGTGMDDETLLRGVKIIKKLDHADIWIRAFGNDGAGEEYITDWDKNEN